MTKYFLQFFLCVLFPFLFLTTLQAQEPEYYGGKEGKKLDWTLFYLQSYYVDSTNNENLAELAIQRMLQELDPFSNYQSKEQLEEQRKRDDGAVNDGLGIRYYIIRDTVTITFIDENGPAGAAGLQLGDRVLAIDNIPTIGGNYQAIDDRLEAKRGTPIAFSIFRKSEKKGINLIITSKTIPVPSVDVAYVLEGNIGYIRINRFTSRTILEFRKALGDLKKQGIKNLVLDLRNNWGGVVNGAIDLADEFLAPNKMIMHASGKGMPREEYFSTEVGGFEKGKVAILVNGSTASASEIFTGAMQEWDRALVIGEVTYGKGLIQQSYLLGDSSAVRLTIGRYYTPTDRTLQRPFNFDSSEDWIFQNIANAQTKNGFTAQLTTPETVNWATKSGRKILQGQGSIIPDLYLPAAKANQPILNQLNKLGIVYRFTVFYVDENRKAYSTQFKDGTAFRLDKKVDKKIAAAFFKYLLANLADQKLAESIANNPMPRAVTQQIKAWMAPQIWENQSYYGVYNEDDAVIIRTVKCIKDGTFDRVGVK